MSKQQTTMPKPVKLSCTTVLAIDGPPNVGRNSQEKKLYDYGIKTGLMTLEYNDNKDPALLEEIVQRCLTEKDAWLALSQTDNEQFAHHCFAGAAKQCINLEQYCFLKGGEKDAVKAAEDETDRLIGLTGSYKKELLDSLQHNREGRSCLPCCACCGKYNPQKRLMCAKCNIAVYCGVDCQKEHWKVHREQCGRQTACAWCGKIPEKPMKCGRCMGVTYCDQAHQKWHWKFSHKKECKAKE